MQNKKQSFWICLCRVQPNFDLVKVKQTRAEHQTKSQISSIVPPFQHHKQSHRREGLKGYKSQKALLIKHCCPLSVHKCAHCLGVGSGTAGGGVSNGNPYSPINSLLLIPIMPIGPKRAKRLCSHYAFRSVIRLYRLCIRCPTSVLGCLRCSRVGSGTAGRVAALSELQ